MIQVNSKTGFICTVCVLGFVFTTLLSVLGHQSAVIIQPSREIAANLFGESIRSALLLGSKWESFSELVGRTENFQDNFDIFSESYNEFAFWVNYTTDGWLIVHSYPSETSSYPYPETETITKYAGTTQQSGSSYIAVDGNDLFYYSPVKINGFVTSVIVVTIDTPDLLVAETSLPSFVENVDVEIRLENTIAYTSDRNVYDFWYTYETELFNGFKLTVSSSKPKEEHNWFPYLLSAVGGLLSIGATFSAYSHAEAVETSQRKTQFLARMSHEIRTPMNGIIGMSDVLNQEEGLPKQVLDCVHVINSCSKHLLNLINNILDLSKIEAKRIEVHPEVFRTSIFKETIHDTWVMTQRDNGVSMRIVYDNVPFDAEVVGDTLKIQQVISNLVTNAVKFTHEGSIKVYVRWVNLESPGRILVSITVVDTGIGIPESSKTDLFKPYTQMSNNNLGQGTGIGLTISRSLAVALGGGLTCTSKEKQGCTFFFKFVVVGHFSEVEREDVTHRERLTERKHEPGQTPQSLLALVVDDNKVNIQVLERILSKKGVTCHTTQSGREAVSMCERCVYDVIFLDKFMPSYDGLSTSRDIRNKGLNTATVIFFCTADVSRKSTRECIASGGTDCIPKPVTSALISAFMSRHCVTKVTKD